MSTAFVGIGTNMGNRIENIEKVSAKENTSFAITKDGKIYNCGLNTSGQLSQSSTTASSILMTGKIINLNEELVDLEMKNAKINVKVEYKNGFKGIKL